MVSCYLADKFQDGHLQDVTPVSNIVHLTEEVVHSSVLCMVAQHQESVALGGQVLFAVEHFLYEIWSIL